MTPFARFPFLRYVICLIVGILLAPYFAGHWLGLLVSLVCLFVLYLFAFTKFSKNLTGLLGLLMVIGVGILVVDIKKEILFKNHYSDFTDAKAIHLVEIVEMVEEKANTWKAIAEVREVIKNDTIYSSHGKTLLYIDKKAERKPELGEKYWLINHLQKIEAPKNPYEFDFRRYMELQEIFDQQYVRKGDFLYAGETEHKSIYYYAMLLNRYADRAVVKSIPKKSVYGVVNAMVLGVRDELDSPLMQAYSAAGAIHVLSVSGMHVGIIYQVLIILLGFIKKRKSRWGQTTFVLVVLSLLWFYAFLTGLSSPVLRSTLMFSMVLIAEFIHKKQNTYNTVAFSAFVLLLWNPNFIFQVGFQLSYLAVLGMLFFQPLLVKLWITDVHKGFHIRILYWFWELTCVSVAAQLATFPLTVYYFHQFPLYFLLANPFVIFFSTLVLCVGLLFIVIYPVIQLFNIYFVLEYIARFLEFLTDLLNLSAKMTEKLPHSMIQFLHFSKLEVCFIFTLLVTIASLWITKSFVWIKSSVLLLVILIWIQVEEQFKISEQKQLVIHSIPKGHAISVLDGTNALIIGDSSFIENKKEIGFRLSNYFSEKGVKDTLRESLLQTNTIRVLTYQQHKLLYIPFRLNKLKVVSNVIFDWIIIGNKAIRKLEDLEGLKYKALILDGSCSEYYAQKILKQSEELGVKAEYLRYSGAKVLFGK
ncbi:ComEC/Rec2 family competence protein [Flectobacillus sp. DC10W]|uniref:ComEC/Rec2 family competence protein n=1 Tax=Flectobacillus longus TaxID=2984207 RepID=A0ABT6YVG0_9BACT|nr:ComEC/Rec2 family competence protein [Flectobacillus longus]MDI9867447.1 ComEC/Rec2 family competence protein [Flectobacillus longus]